MNKPFRERELMQTFALFPLLIAATSFGSALFIAAITTVIYLCTWLAHRCSRTMSTPSQLLVTALVAAAMAGIIDLMLQAFAWKLDGALGGYLPLMAISIVFACNNKNAQQPEFAKIGICAVALIGFGTLRELIGTGSLFGQLELLFGDRASSWRLGFTANDRGFLLSLLPVGGLIAAGLLIAIKNYFSKSVESDAIKPDLTEPNPVAPVKTRRVRVTGPVS